jgi:cytochrome c2
MPASLRSLFALAVALIVGAFAVAWTVARPGDTFDPQAAIAVRAASFPFWEAGAPFGEADAPDPSLAVMGGDAAQGRGLIARNGCGTCHIVTGVDRAHGTVGPSLEAFARRAYVAGIVPNRPGQLIDWLMAPPALAPQTAMPDLGLTEPEARDIAAYLYTLR